MFIGIGMVCYYYMKGKYCEEKETLDKRQSLKRDKKQEGIRYSDNLRSHNRSRSRDYQRKRQIQKEKFIIKLPSNNRQIRQTPKNNAISQNSMINQLRKSTKFSMTHRENKYQGQGEQHLQSSESQNRQDNQSSYDQINFKQIPHFEFTIGWKIGEKYEIQGQLGTGAFGRVLKVKYNNQILAVKIIRPKKQYQKAAKKEAAIVQLLNQADPDNKMHIVKLKDIFLHEKKYFCIAFEPLSFSLFNLIHRNEHEGFPLILVQAFSRQLFQTVDFMHSLGYTHTDLKPENILLCSGQLKQAFHPRVKEYFLPLSSEIKLIDFGGATHQKEVHNSIITTRSYRSPEVILKCFKWNKLSDIWSIGCIISQLLTGKILFQSTNNDFEHLLIICEVLQQFFPPWMGNNCENQLKEIFIQGRINQSLSVDYGVNWEKVIISRKIDQIFQRHPLLYDLVQKCLQIDPKLRISCESALKHPFFDISYV